MKLKTILAVGVSIPVSGVLQFFDKYVFNDWEFLRWLVVLMVVDTVLGLVKHYIIHDISSKGYSMVARKIIVYTSIMILANVISHFTIGGHPQDDLEWFGTFCCTILMVRETLSVIENVEGICPGFFPKAIVKRLREYDSKTGKRLKKESEEDDEEY